MKKTICLILAFLAFVYNFKASEENALQEGASHSTHVENALRSLFLPIFANAENYLSTKCFAFAEDDEISDEDKTVISSILCDGIFDKFITSYDGKKWYYTDNCVVVSYNVNTFCVYIAPADSNSKEISIDSLKQRAIHSGIFKRKSFILCEAHEENGSLAVECYDDISSVRYTLNSKKNSIVKVEIKYEG